MQKPTQKRTEQRELADYYTRSGLLGVRRLASSTLFGLDELDSAR
jgi:hypothetical protein